MYVIIRGARRVRALISQLRFPMPSGSITKPWSLRRAIRLPSTFRRLNMPSKRSIKRAAASFVLSFGSTYRSESEAGLADRLSRPLEAAGRVHHGIA